MVNRSTRLEVILGLKDETKKGFSSASRGLSGFNDKLKGMRLQLLAVAGAVTGIAVVSIKAASDLEESFQAAEVTFKSAFGTVEDFAENTADAFNLSKRAAFEYTAQLGGIFNASGLAAGASADMSVAATKLAADLASFKNLEIDVALQKIRAGLVGEVEPLRTVGVLLNAASVEAKAMELGLADANGVISEGAKVQARFAVIMEQLSDAQGDVARTSESVANQMWDVKQGMEDASAEIGAVLLPVVADLLSHLSDLVDWFSNLDDGTKVLIVQAALVAAGIAAIGLVLPGVIAGFGLLTSAVMALNTAFLLLLANPIVAAMVAIVAGLIAVTVWFNNLKSAEENAADGVERITKEMDEFKGMMKDVGGELEGFTQQWDSSTMEFVENSDTRIEQSKEERDSLIDFMQDVIDKKKQEIQNHLDASKLLGELFARRREREQNITDFEAEQLENRKKAWLEAKDERVRIAEEEAQAVIDQLALMADAAEKLQKEQFAAVQAMASTFQLPGMNTTPSFGNDTEAGLLKGAGSNVFVDPQTGRLVAKTVTGGFTFLGKNPAFFNDDGSPRVFFGEESQAFARSQNEALTARMNITINVAGGIIAEREVLSLVQQGIDEAAAQTNGFDSFNMGANASGSFN